MKIIKFKPVLAAMFIAAGMTAGVANAAGSNFGGLYGGVQLGYGQLDTIHNDLDDWYWDARNASSKDKGALIGLRVGYDIVSGSQIFGVLAEGSITDLDSVKEYYPSEPSYKAGSTIKALGSLRGKYGVVSDKLAVFGTAGLALAKLKHQMQDTDGSLEGFNEDGKSTGFVFGIGASYALSNTASIGVDVSRYQFGSKIHEVKNEDGIPTGYFFTLKDQIDVVSFSYNMRF